MDRAWWDRYYREVRQLFKGAVFSPLDGCYSVRRAEIHHYHNSGAGVIALAAWLGAKTVYMLGYDLRHTGGKTHWHGDHPAGLANAGKIDTWPRHFMQLGIDHPGVEIINCSRVSALDCFVKVPLEAALCAQ